MRQLSAAAGLLLAALVLFLDGQAARPADVDLDALKPGLIATYNDQAQPQASEIVRLDPSIAIHWKAGETAHPRLAPSGSVQWAGYINILRAGSYRFSARVRGQLRVQIAGKDVLSVDGKADQPDLQPGPEVRLEAGVHELRATFSRTDGPARVELFWQAPHFRPEPLPYDHLFHIPMQAPPRLAAERTLERGRFLAEEFNCVGCHRPDAQDKLAKTLQGRQGPDLSQVGSRTQPGWLHAWLLNPQHLRHTAAMPRMFADDENGKAEAYAVARYLTTLGTPKPAPKPANPKEIQTSLAAGQRLFGSVGCTACHQEEQPKGERFQSLYGDPRTYALGALGSKTTAESLAAFIANPHALDPSGRMPNLLLEQKEALDIGRFLAERTDEKMPKALPEAPFEALGEAAYKGLNPTAAEMAVFNKLKVDDQWLALGQRLVSARGCVNCHKVAPAGKALAVLPAKASWETLKAGKTLTAGCLTDAPAQRGAAPAFPLTPAERTALRAFLQEGTRGSGSPSPTHTARLTLHRFNCFACHSRNGKGGLTQDMIEQLRVYEKAENAEAVLPPPLTGIGHKLRTPWMRQVLTQRGRARPWMALRMPQFGDAVVGQLPEAFAYLEGTEPDESIYQAPINAKTIEAGRHLVGKNAFGCISCHDLAGIPNTGTRGPDLAGMNQRVRYDWYLRWLSEAQRMQPGTKMPTVFLDGKTQLPNVLDGSATTQAAAMWAYLSLGPTLPLPVGMEPAIKGQVLKVTERPVLLRCFMPEAGAKSIALGFPNGVNLAFDASACRLVYGWSGNFLDTAPIWEGRGGTPVKVLGPRFWSAPAGQPWALNDSNEPPDFVAQAQDPAYGAPLPENKVFQGIKQLQFLGHSADEAGVTTFRYLVAAGEKNPLSVSERLEPLRHAVAVGVGRRFALQQPASRVAWLLAGETTGEPKLLDENGAAVPLDLKAARQEVPLAERLLLLPQGDKTAVLAVPSAPRGASWVLLKTGTTWQALVRLPAPTQAADVQLSVNVWVPYRPDAALLKELAVAK